MDSMESLLRSRKPTEPPQLTALRKYVLEVHRSDSRVSVSQRSYNLVVPSGMIATTLLMEMPKIVEYCDLDKKLYIRIGHF